MQIDKKNKEFKRTSRFVIFLSLVFVLTTISLSTIIYIKYRATQTWTSSKLNSNMSNITPEFAKNTYTVEMADDINRLNDVTSILEKIQKNNGLTDETIKSANIAYDESQSILKKYNITTGEAIKNQNTLKMYIDIFNVEQSAYKKPETKQLEQLIAMLNKKLIEKETETDNVILKRLNTIVSDYQALNTFSDTFIPQLGKIKNGIVTVKSDITEEMTNQIITSIDDAHLDKFSNIKKLKTIMRSAKWNKIINSNMQLSEKQKWENIYAAFSALSASQYIEVSKVRTLSDAEKLGIRHRDLVWVSSRRGKVISRADVSERINTGTVYMTYQWWIGACNELVTENLSPITKTPEYKYCAVNVEPIADQRAAEQYVIDEYNKLKTRLRESAMG